MIVIGLCGPAGSGKTTVAHYLARTYGARLYAFAEPLKLIIQRAFELPDSCLWGTQTEKETAIPWLGVSARFLMQRIGTNGIRSVFGDDFWAKHTMNKIEDDQPKLAVVEDVRFLSEAAYLRAWCDPSPGYSPHIRRIPGYVWKLDTPWRASDADPTHPSEAEWPSIQEDHRIAPSVKTLEALHLEVDRACLKFGITPTLRSIEAP